MAGKLICSACGAEVPSDAPPGVCVACFLSVGLRGEDDSLRLAAQRETMATAPTAHPNVGDRIGRYRLLERIGEGGFGTVYLAEQTEPFYCKVALKVIRVDATYEQGIARFEAECQALAILNHPNIAKVLDAGVTEQGWPYAVMEYVEGARLTDYCDTKCLSIRERLLLFIQVCRAIQHAHVNRIIHRDIKPANILVTLSGDERVAVPKVIDFGIAKAMPGQRLTQKPLHTIRGEFRGTPTYMAPEQVEMSGLPTDNGIDIYALGSLLYELLTGTTPFERERFIDKEGNLRLAETCRILREEMPPRPSLRASTLGAGVQAEVAKQRETDPPGLVRLIRGDLDRIVMKCLAKDRNRRYESAAELAQAVIRFLDQRPPSVRPPPLQRFSEMVRRRPIALSAGAISLAGALVLLHVAWGRWRAPSPGGGTIPPAKPLPHAVESEAAANVLNEAYSGAPALPASGLITPRLTFSVFARRSGSTMVSPLENGDVLESELDGYFIVVRSLSDGFLYIFQVDASGKAQWLFPENGFFSVSSGVNPVRGGEVLQVPSAAKGEFYLDTTTGVEHIYLVFSAARWPQLEAALSTSGLEFRGSTNSQGVQEPNNLETRGVAGTRVEGSGMSTISHEVVLKGATNTVVLSGQPYTASGGFLVVERWFKHLNHR